MYFKVFENWYKTLELLSSEEDREKFALAIIRAGFGQKINPGEVFKDDARTADQLKTALAQIEKVIEASKASRENGTKGGRPVTVEDREIWEYCRDHPEQKGEEVAAHFGLAPWTLYKKAGWKNRKKDSWYEF